MRSALTATFMCLAAACSSENVSTAEISREKVVGGSIETDYPAAGFLVSGDGASTLSGPKCGAALIAPNIAITAAHCILFAWRSGVSTFGYAQGTVDVHIIYPARRVVTHPNYSLQNSPRYRHDVAVLVLESDVPGPYLTVAEAATDTLATFVGYGRTEPGGRNVQQGLTRERRSARQLVTARDDFNIWAAGQDAGLCWGDSGGPLISQNGELVFGVLSDFDDAFECFSGNEMIFTSLARERAFLDNAMVGATCDVRCVDYEYAPGECRYGWYCDGTCLTDTGCS